MLVPMKPALELVHDYTSQEWTWIVLEPYASIEGFLIHFMPLRKDRFECICNGVGNMFGQKVMRTSGCKRSASARNIAGNE